MPSARSRRLLAVPSQSTTSAVQARGPQSGVSCDAPALPDDRQSAADLQSRNQQLTALNGHLRQALRDAEQQAELTRLATSQLLAGAAHDLRQPIQTLFLLQGMLSNVVEGDKARRLVVRFDETLTSLSNRLAALDIRQTEPIPTTPERLDDSTRHAVLPIVAQMIPVVPADPAADTVKIPSGAPSIFIVDDDGPVRDTLRAVLEEEGLKVEDFASCEDFLASYQPGREACLLIDAYLPGMSGLALLRQLQADGDRLPAIMITGNSDVAIAVQAMKSGASDFIEKPVRRADLLESVERALAQSRDGNELFAWHEDAVKSLAELTPRQRQIMDMVLAGQASKNIAADLGISQRTVENHRAAIMQRTGAASLPALARLALAAAKSDASEQPPVAASLASAI